MGFAAVKPVPIECANNAALYYRYSSDKQTENSIDGQRRACLDYCEKHGYNVVAEYIDRAMSGTNDNRPEFQRMIEDSEKRQFAFIIVYRFDRFARNRFDSAIYKKRLEMFGVRVLSASEQIGDGDEGIILESIYEAMDEAYSRRLSRITKRGMREAAIKGFWTGGNVPLGYKVEEKKLVIDERTAPAVRLIFELYADGKTKQQIADELNSRGFKTKQGKPFTCANFTAIITNKIYYGDYSFEDIERKCPSIISRELYDKVQELLNKNKRCFGRKVAETFFALGGKVFCGNCGAAMIGDAGTSRSGERHYYYTCGKRKKARSCHKKSERKDFIEWYVCEQTVKFVLTPSNIKTIAERVVAKSEEELNSGELAAYEKQLQTIEREFDSLVDSLIKTNSPSLIKRINDRVEDLEKQKESAEAEISKLRLRQSLRLTVKEVESYLRGFCKGDLLDEDFRRKLINSLINCVYLFDDKIVIYFNVRGYKQISYIDMLADVDALTESEVPCSDSLRQGEPYSKLSEHIRFIFVNGYFGVVISRG